MSRETRGSYCGAGGDWHCSRKEAARNWKSFERFLKRQNDFRKTLEAAPDEMSPEMAAKILKCSRYAVRKAMSSGKIQARRTGKFYLIGKYELWFFFAVYLVGF